MTSYHYDRERSTLRECVAFLNRIGKLVIIDEIAEAVNFSTTACYNALKVALHDGYVTTGQKLKRCAGKGNLKITYLPTGKRLPPTRSVTVKALEDRQREARRRAELAASRSTDFEPFRHPWDEWLFGPAPVATSTQQFTRRVFKMDMTVSHDELEEST